MEFLVYALRVSFRSYTVLVSPTDPSQVPVQSMCRDLGKPVDLGGPRWEKVEVILLSTGVGTVSELRCPGPFDPDVRRFWGCHPHRTFLVLSSSLLLHEDGLPLHSRPSSKPVPGVGGRTCAGGGGRVLDVRVRAAVVTPDLGGRRSRVVVLNRYLNLVSVT